MMWYGHGFGYGLIAMLIGLLTAAIVVVIIFRFVDRTSREIGPRRSTPDEVLADRYARGELTDEEYQHRTNVLRDQQHSAQLDREGSCSGIG
jgi:putative membrane protein